MEKNIEFKKVVGNTVVKFVSLKTTQSRFLMQLVVFRQQLAEQLAEGFISVAATDTFVNCLRHIRCTEDLDYTDDGLDERQSEVIDQRINEQLYTLMGFQFADMYHEFDDIRYKYPDINVGQFKDAIGQYADAIVQEAAKYNENVGKSSFDDLLLTAAMIAAKKADDFDSNATFAAASESLLEQLERAGDSAAKRTAAAIVTMELGDQIYQRAVVMFK